MNNKLSLMFSLSLVNITILLLVCIIIAKQKNIKPYIYSGDELLN